MFSGRTARIYPPGDQEVEAQTPFGVMYGEWVAPGDAVLDAGDQVICCYGRPALAFSTGYAKSVVDPWVSESLARRNQSNIALWPAQLVPYPPLPEIHCSTIDLMGEPAFPLLPYQLACAAVDGLVKVSVPSWDP